MAFRSTLCFSMVITLLLFIQDPVNSLSFQYGIRDMFSEENGIVTLCRAIDPTNKPMMTDTVKLVAAVSLLPEG